MGILHLLLVFGQYLYKQFPDMRLVSFGGQFHTDLVLLPGLSQIIM